MNADRFSVTYRLTGSASEAAAKAADICLEQTVELPDELITDSDIREHILGQVVSLKEVAPGCCEALISFAVDLCAFDLSQLLNVVFGNISLKPGIRLERLDLPQNLLQAFKGPRFGREGLRDYLGIYDRPLLCTALKPLGWSSEQHAELAYQLALGGIDLIKDDHGLSDQRFSPFEERVQRCVDAVRKANRETGFNCIYVPHIAGPIDRVYEHALFAKQAGAGGLMFCPGLIGLDTMRWIADDDRIALPILAHPAFQGSFITGANEGLSHFALFGQLTRLAGADAVIFPNYGGRFAFSREDCRNLADGTACDMGSIKSIFPTPAGGMSLAGVPEMCEFYGCDVILLIGGGLRKEVSNLVESCHAFKRLVENSI